MNRHTRLFVIICSLLGIPLQGVANEPACDPNSFGAKAVRTCDRGSPTCLPSWVPPEVRQIEVGISTEYVGYSINDGRASWRAIDIGLRKEIRVERYAGSQLTKAPLIQTPNEKEYRREVNEGGRHWVDHVLVSEVTQDRVTELTCLAIPLWSEPENLYLLVTDVSRNVVLLNGSAVRRHGSGGVRGRAEEVWKAIAK